MEILKKMVLYILLPSLLSSCLVNSDGTVTITSPIESDTYISSSDPSDHSDLNFLSLYKGLGGENRILLKLPTGENNSESHLDTCIGNPFCFVFFLPLFILKEIIAPGCNDDSFTAANLNWAYLELNTEDSSSPAVGSITIELLAQPWWHSVNWTTAHPFSSEGKWSTNGGSIDTSQSFDPSCTNLEGGQTCAAGEVKFDMTDYLATLLDNPNSTHYGLRLRFANNANELRFFSSQSSSISSPQLVANYNCVTTNKTQTNRYYLGTPLQ